MEGKTLWFAKPGKRNTEATLAIAKARMEALGIKQVVVASSHGYTARLAHEAFAPLDCKIVVVSIGHGWEEKGWCMEEKTAQALRDMGLIVFTGIHALGDGVGTAFSAKFGGRSPAEIVRDTLYCFGQGMKVAVECVLMAAEAGYLDMDQEVISIAGTDEGADTAIVCRPSYAKTFHKLRVREVLAKPR